MNVAGFTFLLFAIVFLFHVTLWRVRLPKSQTRTLLLIFFGSLPAALAASLLVPGSSPLHLSGFWQYTQVCLFHIAMSLAYIEFYTAIEECSPSFTVLLFVEQAGGKGRLEEEIYEVIDDDFIVGNRLQSMVDGGFADRHNDRYRLTATGRVWARIFQMARRVYRLKLGG